MATTAPAPTKRTIYEREHNQYRKSFATFLQREVVPHFAEWEENGIVPRELFVKMAEGGFLSMPVPEEYGGVGVDDFRYSAVIAEEAQRAGVGNAIAGPQLHTDIVVPYLIKAATDEQKARWLPSIAAGETILAIGMTEPSTGSDLAAIKTRAVRNDDHYVVNGSKTFITNGVNAGQVVIIVVAKTDPAEGGQGGTSLIVVETDGAEGFRTRPQPRTRSAMEANGHLRTVLQRRDQVPGGQSSSAAARASGFVQLMQQARPQERLNIAVSRASPPPSAALEATLEPTSRSARPSASRILARSRTPSFKLAEVQDQADRWPRSFVDRPASACQGCNEASSTPPTASMAKYWVTDMLRARSPGRDACSCTAAMGI